MLRLLYINIHRFDFVNLAKANLCCRLFFKAQRVHKTLVTTSPVRLRMLCVTFLFFAAIAYTSDRLEGDYMGTFQQAPLQYSKPISWVFHG